MKKFLTPLMAIALAFLITTGLVLRASDSPSESLAYFIKTVHADRVLVVEPNLSSFVKAGASDAGEGLLGALEEIGQQYEITASRIIQVERNIGSVVPNLLVYVQPSKVGQAIEADLMPVN
jgi:hypothetical protein